MVLWERRLLELTGYCDLFFSVIVMAFLYTNVDNYFVYCVPTCLGHCLS